jgi:predicted transport protein
MATPEQQAQTMLNNIPEKTGKSLAEWKDLISAESLDKHGKIVSFLKSEWQVTHGFANLIAHEYLNPKDDDEPDLIAAQYAKGKEGLFPIYQNLIRHIEQFGSDVEIAPKKAYVSLRRKKQFALIQPSTKTRLDLGVNLKGSEVTDRFEASGSFNAMVSHRVRITDGDQIDESLIAFIRQAYEAAG